MAKLTIQLFLDARQAMAPLVPALTSWYREWSTLPDTECKVYAVVRTRVAPLLRSSYEESLEEADSASVLRAAVEWLRDHPPANERQVIHCVSGCSRRLAGGFPEPEAREILRQLCPKGPTYVTASTIGYVGNVLVNHCGWPERACLAIGNSVEKVEVAGLIWKQRFQRLQSTHNSEMGEMLLRMRVHDARPVYPSLADLHEVGTPVPDIEGKWQEFEARLRTHDWLFSMSDDSRVYGKGSIEWRGIQSLREQLAFVDPVRTDALFRQHAPPTYGV